MICAVSMHSGICFLMEILLALTIHELGHIAAIKILKGKLTQIIFSGVGINIKAEFCADNDNIERLFVALAGPFANLTAFFAFFAIDRNVSRLCMAFALYSLIPIEGFDGRDIIGAFFKFGDKAELFVVILYFSGLIALLSAMNMLNLMGLSVLLYLILLTLASDETA